MVWDQEGRVATFNDGLDLVVRFRLIQDVTLVGVIAILPFFMVFTPDYKCCGFI